MCCDCLGRVKHCDIYWHFQTEKKPFFQVKRERYNRLTNQVQNGYFGYFLFSQKGQ